MKQMMEQIETARVQRLEAQLAVLSRDNQRLSFELEQLRGRGVRALVEEAAGKLDQKITRNIKKLNRRPHRRSTPDTVVLAGSSSRHQLILAARRADVAAFSQQHGNSFMYLLAYGLYRFIRGAVVITFKLLWKLWRLLKRVIKKAVR